MKNTPLLLWALALAVFAIITTELGIIGLLLQLVSQRSISATQVGLLVSTYAVVVAITGSFMTLLMSGWNKKHVLLGVMLLFVMSGGFQSHFKEVQGTKLHYSEPLVGATCWFCDSGSLASVWLSAEGATLRHTWLAWRGTGGWCQAGVNHPCNYGIRIHNYKDD